MKRKLLFTMVLAVLTTTAAEARKFKVAVAMPEAQHTQFERTAQWALQTIAAGQADDYILGFFMEYLKTTFEFGKGNKVKSAVFYENPKPETSQGSVTYSSSQTMGFNVALNGGVAGHHAARR